ncbi:MAG TPA: DUF1824 family protein [Candidatus Sericytochromatia bacterium]|jgi:hypothetical protein
MHQQAHLTVQAAQKLLKNYDCMSSKTVDSEVEKALLRQALLLLTEHCDYQILGICADTTHEGIATLKSYLEAFGYEEDLNLPWVEDAVYIKFNLKNGSSYINSYTGNHRGVLVSCQSVYEGGINEMYGHLPLDLFMNVS